MTDAERADRDGAEAGTETDADRRIAVVLDYLPHGRPDDDRPQYQKSPLAHAIGERDFLLYELTLREDADLSIGDRLVVEPTPDDDVVESVRELDYDDLSRGAEQELEYVVEEIVDRNEERFVDFYNEAQPITLRLHQLNLLPGIGKKLRNNVLDERKRDPFGSFADLDDRVSGLHRPKEVVIERILEELREDDLKYVTFVGRETPAADG